MNYLNTFPTCMCPSCAIFYFSDEPPKVTNHPKSLSNVFQGNLVTFTVQATGTDPLSYHWQWMSVEKNWSKEWKSCDSEWCDGATLTISKVQKSNEGSYRCVISNHVGNQTSNSANLSVGKNPAINVRIHKVISL